MNISISTIRKKWMSISHILRIFIGLILGAILGILIPSVSFIGVFGTLFVSLLKAIAPILVAVLVTYSISKAGDGLGPRFRKVILRYILSTFIAAACAVIGSKLFPVTLQLNQVTSSTLETASLPEIFGNLLNNITTNPISAIAQANYLGVLFWSILLGIGFKTLAKKETISILHDLADVISHIVKWIIEFAPIGIMGLVFTAVSTSGLHIFTTYGHLLLLLVGCMLINTFIFNPLISFLMLKKNPYPLLFTCLKESGLNAFFTRSSAANIPINLALCKKLGLDEDFYSVSIPLGATINMDGAAVTITVFTLATAHTLGIEITFASALLLCIASTMGACGASGVAGGSLLLIPMACSFFGISNDIAMQAVAIGFIVGVVQDAVETALNSSGDVFFTATVDYYEKMKLKK